MIYNEPFLLLIIGLVGLGTLAYFMLNLVFSHREKMLKLKLSNQPLMRDNFESSYTKNKVQALERLMLLIERISPEQVANRVSFEDFGLDEYEIALNLTINKEFEFNGVQQLYVSEQLWEILNLTKLSIIKLISELADDQRSKGHLASDLYQNLIVEGAKRQLCQTAKNALRQEAALVV